MTLNERLCQLETEILFRKVLDEKDQELIRQIRRNEVRPEVLEGSGLNVFPIGARKIVCVDGDLDTAGSQDLLQKLDVLEKDDNGQIKGVIVVIGSSANVTHQARQVLRDARVEVLDESAEARP